MQIFVRTCFASAPLSVSVSPTATAGDLIHGLVPAAFQDGFYVSHGGKLLSPSSNLADVGIREYSTLELGTRVRGGGGDGGATGAESRDCYLNMYRERKPDKVDPNEAKLARCRCALSSESLKPPCVMDPLGNVYNKAAAVHALLSKTLPKKLRYIRGLKDLVTIHLSSIPGVDADDEHVETKFQCPITGQEFNGKFKFVALRGCGHVLSVRAFKEVHSTACLVCYTPFKEEDKIVLNGTDEEMAALRERMEAERAATKSKNKKEKNGEAKNGEAIAANGSKIEIEIQSKESAANGSKLEIQIQSKESVKRKEGSPGLKDESSRATAKKAKPLLPIPANATKEVYQSIFTSSGNRSKIKETYSCRALPLGRN